MKKYLIIMLIALVALAICACSITEPTGITYTPGTTQPTTPTTSGRPTVPTQQATVTVPTTSPTEPAPTSNIPNTIPTEPTISTAPTVPTEPTVPHICEYKECRSVEATCTQEGYVEYACECGQSFQAFTGKAPHEYQQTEEGATCIHCGEKQEAPEEGGDNADC